MSKLLRDNQEAVKAIIGWCAFNSGGRVQGTRPEGYETVGEGNEWNEEMWCHDRVEASIMIYKEAYTLHGYGNIAGQQLRKWLKTFFWESEPLAKVGPYEHLLALELLRFKKVVSSECLKNPRPKFFEVA
jgi:hypothetical protein